MDSAVRDLLIGRLLDGRYQVVDLVARGGMATVYRAVDRRLDREVAVKVMHAHLADDDDFVARFVREARSAAKLSHPNVVSVFDQGADRSPDTGDVLYLAMELLPGRTLRDVLGDHGVLTPREALTVLEPVLDALAAAHRAGIVHRDVKPENVILTDDGRVKVADFGLAKAMTGGSNQSGALIGTVAYLAPELVAHGQADERSDVYAAGVMLFEMLTGCQPFTGDVPMQVAYRHVHEDVPKPSTVAADLPSELDDLVALAVARDPAERAPDAASWLASVRRVHAELTDAVLDHRPPRPPAPVEAHATDDAGPPGAATDLFAAPDLDSLLPESSPGRPTPGPSAGPSARPNGGQVAGPAAGFVPGPAWAQPPAAPGVSNPTMPLPQLTGLRALRERRRREADDDRDLDAAQATPRPAKLPRMPARRRPDLDPDQRRRGLAGLAVLLAIVASIALGGWWIVAGPGAFTTTPAITNLTLSEAQSVLAAQGLTARSEPGEYDDKIAKDHVLRTDPAPGERVRKKGTVRIYLSLGTASRTVPKLGGKTAAEATAALKELGLVVGKTTNGYHDKIAKGKVIRSSPASGEIVKVGDTVTLTVSQGPQPVTVPDVNGAWLDDAKKTLEEAGLVVAITEEVAQGVEPGRVLRQDVPAGESRPRGSTVTLVVAKGEDMVIVPDVTGRTFQEARDILQGQGFEVDRQRVGGFFNRVQSQQPAGGTSAARGSTVTVFVI